MFSPYRPQEFISAAVFVVSLGPEKSSVLPGKEKRAEKYKEDELYASPVDVKTLLKAIPQQRKNAMTRSGVAVSVIL